MPRIIKGIAPRLQDLELTRELANELLENRPSGQPLIREQHFPRTNAVRTTVIWDKWARLEDEDRIEVILQAYEQVEGAEFRDRIALAMGLTVEEAHEAGLLPFQLTPLLRNDDEVTWEQCRTAMIDEGASTLDDPERPVLRFATLDEAEQSRRRLIDRLPASKAVWAIKQEVPAIAD
jgi:hypothetical protein